jgi:hypothetical protein
MNRFPSRPSRSRRRNAEIWTVRLAGSTNRFDQTRAISSCLLTNSPGRSSKIMSICMARLPRGTGSSPFSRRSCAGSKRNDPNETSLVVAPAGLLGFSGSVSGPRTRRLTPNPGSGLNRSSTGAPPNCKHSEGVLDPTKGETLRSFDPGASVPGIKGTSFRAWLIDLPLREARTTIVVRRNLMIWNAAIYSALVVRDSLIVSLR